MMMRITLAILLSLMLGLTSQSMAVARGAAAATGQMILCTGTGPVAVYFDAEGRPTSAPHLCPDSALNLIATVVSDIAPAPIRVVLFAPSVALSKRLAPISPHPAPPSRGPPDPV